MKASAVLSIFLMTSASGLGQVPTPGFGDKGCAEESVFSERTPISSEDFIEVHRIHCFTNCPLYTVRIYGDGRLVWHGDKAVRAIGDATAVIDPGQAQTLIASARHMGFGGLCDEYAMRGFDGTRWDTSLRIAGRVKTVANQGPSNAPAWLYKLDKQIYELSAVQDLIGPRPVRSSSQK